ncbi:PepSY domain-containing protein [Tardiphaga sp. 866_E4_N2_1]|uniref:PepSY domain-containing protein n=1 Tax=unclassified Tardiphaga TaxID=2631404 RepID=UPI003F2119F2
MAPNRIRTRGAGQMKRMLFPRITKGAIVVFLIALFPAHTFIPSNALASSEMADPSAARTATAPGRIEIGEEVQAFKKAKLSVADAIRIIEARSSGAKVVDIGFDASAQQPGYVVKSLHRNHMRQATVDAVTGEILRQQRPIHVSKLSRDDKAELASFHRSAIGLSESVPIAESYGKGKAVSAGLSIEDGRFLFLIVVVGDDGLRLISIDPIEGRKNR